MSYTEIPRDASADSVRLVSYDGLPAASPPTSEFSRLQFSCGSGEKQRSIRFREKTPKPRQKYCTISPEVMITTTTHQQQHSSSNGLRLLAAKSQSLPRNSSLGRQDSKDPALLNVLRLCPEELAGQITLLDFETFAAITCAELTSCAWTKKEKLTVTPNIVNFTRRFNHISFWTVEEILKGRTPKERAEIIAHFIKVAKRLYEHNNLHSLFAVISAMRTAAVYRMALTWNCLPKKEKATLERLATLFSDDNNWAQLRGYLDSLKLPCIPYLGLFLTDLVYIDLAHPNRTQGLEPEQRALKMNNVLRVISNYQSSDYGYIQPVPKVQKYLHAIRYIEELQNIFEEEQYKKSLHLEPAPSPCSSKESVVSSLNLSPAKSNSLRASTPASAHAPHVHAAFVPGHRKCNSLGSNIFQKLHGIRPLNDTAPDADEPRHLLDDSVLEIRCQDPETASRKSSDSTVGDVEPSLGGGLDFQGYVRRKTLLKHGKKPAVSSWQRFWIQVWANSLIYFPPKSLKGCDRTDFKREPSKIRSLDGWTATSVESTAQGGTFQLINGEFGHIYKFRTNSPEMTALWLKALQGNSATGSGAGGRKPSAPNLMSFE